MLITERTTCRSCGKELPRENVLALGEQTIADFLEEGEQGRGRAPLTLVSCQGCGLLQLRYTVDPDTLYRRFWYRSSVNELMRAALADVVASIKKFAKVEKGDVVGDIGVNDGCILTNYEEGIELVGFEPAYQLAQEAQQRIPNAKVVADYFSAAKALEASGGKKYKALTACAVFYDLDDPNVFLKDVGEVLDEKGIFLIQMNYLRTMLRDLIFDNISHEHLCYYSLASLKQLVERHGLKIIHVELNAVNGGSIRVIMTKEQGREADGSVEEQLQQEQHSYLEQSYRHFGERVQTTTRQLRDFLVAVRKAGKRVYAYGASTRGLVILQKVLGEESAREFLVGVAERDPNKIGKRMAGVNLSIVSEQEARKKADYFFLLPWHFWPTISRRERDWMAAGGKFIIPLPYPKVISLREGEKAQEFLPVIVELREELQGVGV